ncbi:MAG: hypothetical protein Q4D29_10175 [Lachnospiraceae bacterium]|nr:hypothetical protein [Lachnospiraceae bacterium]
MSKFQIPPQLMNMFKSGNPQQIAMNLLQSRAGNNEMAQNLLNMINGGDMAGVEAVTKNILKSRGLDPDEVMQQVQSQFK